MPRDLKAALGGKKPLLAFCAPAALNHWARAHQWGNFKYLQAGNYLRENPEGVTDLEMALEYISAAQRHLAHISDNIVRYMAGGLRAAALPEIAASSEDAESHLPQWGHVLASVGIAIQKLADAGLIPADPGTPWIHFYEEQHQPGELILKEKSK